MLVIQRPTVAAVGEATGNRQKFSVSPLDPGLGHTIGNSLRRMLLSSIPGAAITSVKFEKALHEFTTIDGVTEDVTEIILNLKDIVVKSEVDDAVAISVDVSGPADLKAKDIPLPAGIEFVNGDQHIATLSAKARLSVEITVERGKGYLGSDRDSGRKTIGVIPVDALFSPVRRVSFDVEPTRVAQSTNFDNLILDIETDGS
ncbi:MAG: DNA-directed RNA polymerase subunit alpha, partial [Ilumatobacteraceae bacterium]